MTRFVAWFQQVIVAAAGSAQGVNDDRVVLIGRALTLAAIFCLAFFAAYRHYFWQEKELRQLYWASVSLLGLVVISKYTIYHFAKGYIPDRLPIYAIPSPKVWSVWWFLLPNVIFALWLHYREKMASLSPRKFLASLYVVFVAFAVSGAALRQGVYSIYERFSREYWEYTGNLHLINNLFSFLHDYLVSITLLASHTTTHPPGFTVLLYLLQQLFRVDVLGLSILVVMVGGLTIVPIYYLLKSRLSEADARRGVTLFIFFPSVVIMGAVSMDFTLVTSTWLAIALLYFGWKRNGWLAFLGGVAVAVALFSHFIIFLLSPLFLYIIYCVWQESGHHSAVLPRVGVSLMGVLVFFLGLYALTGYSIIENYWVARLIQDKIVESNFRTVGTYLLYAFMNMLSFGIYLGAPSLVILSKNLKKIWQERGVYMIGFSLVIWLTLIGIFQGETERLWLFVVPWFIFPLIKSLRERGPLQFTAFISLLFFQVILTRVLFYTYW